MKRRNFLKSTALTAAASLVVPRNGQAAGMGNKDQFIYRQLGKTDIRLPVVSMGVMRSDNPNLVKAALRSGIKYLDTAHGYQDGRNETMLGKLLREVPRETFIISTKVHVDGVDQATGKYTSDTSPKAFLDKFNTSLERLGMDYVDILYMHGAYHREAVLYEPILEVMKQLKADGRIRYMGVSTHRNEPEVIRAAAESKVYDVVLTAINYTQEHYGEVKKAISEAAGAGMGIVGMKTMAGGYLDRARTRPVNARAALKFVLMDENIHTTIPGFTTFNDLDESLSVMKDLKLTDEEMKDLDLQKSQGSLYCDACSTCMGQCIKKLPIPDIMRSYMYAYGYNHTKDARYLLNSLRLDNDPCGDCHRCPVSCPKKFEVRSKVNDILRLREVPDEFLV